MAMESSLNGPRIDVCICTFRRSSLIKTLSSLDRQSGAPSFRVVIADNDHTPSAMEMVESARRRSGMDIHYVHAPARNISIARNACLDAARAEYIAWIDDDEEAAQDWLSQLFTAVEAAEADAAFGPVQALYPSSAPAWAAQADLHSTRAVETSRGVETGYTCNAIVRRAAADCLRFDEGLGRSGGEDTDFFWRMHNSGARFVAAPKALMFERVEPARLNMRWLTARAFRSGQSHSRRFTSSLNERLRVMPVAAAKGVYCGFAALASAANGAAWRRSVVRGMVHLGVVARLAGMREPKLY